MGITERKERQRAELREQILSAARRIVLDHGFESLTMRKIADAIEYSPATIYLYFENREAIGRQLCTEAFEHLVSYMGPMIQIPDPVERLIAIGRAYARFGFENPKEYRLLFMTDAVYMEALFPPEQAKDATDPGQRAFEFVEESVRIAQAAGHVLERPPTEIAELLWTSTHGIVSMSLTCAQMLDTPPERLVELLCSTLLRGLAPAPSSAHEAP